MSAAHDGGCAVLLQDGRILIAGGSDANGPTAGVDILNTDGTWSSAPAMISPRTHQACAVLQGGQVLAAGGVTTGNAISNAAELFDPSANTWAQLPAMTQARAGATASLLPDGRVLLAAGQTSSGPSNTLEIFDPKAQAFTFAGTLSAARQDAAATVLHDGRVLVAGGAGLDTNGNATVLASSDIYDPVTGSVSSGPALNVARSKHSATTQLDGKVVVIGGSDGSNDLASIEVYDPAVGGNFTLVSAVLGAPRSGHLALLLPNNNEVLVTGGQSAGVDLASAELYVPWGNQGAGAVQATGAMLAARSQASGASLSAVNGLTLVAGGSAQTSAELYSFATVTTDQSDYAPGTPVTITGSGWQPGETVTLTLVESPLIDTHAAMTAVADQNGNIFNSQFAPDSYDVSVRFYLTATGLKSQAQNTFTDGNATSVSGTVTSSATSNPISGATITCTSGCTNTPGASTTSSATGEYIFDGKTGDGPKLTFNGNGPASITLTATAPGFNSATVTFTASNNQSYVENFSLTPACTSASITGQPQNQTVTYGQTATFSVTATGTAPLSYQWLKNGSTVTGATSSSYSFSPQVSDSGSSFSVQVSNACTSPAKLSSSASLTVTPASATVTLANLNQTYSGSPESVTVTTNPTGLTTSVTYNGSSTAPTNAGSYAVAATVTDPNYTGSANGTLVIGQASQTITFAAIPTHTYGDPAFAVSPTASSGLVVSLSASGNCTLSGSAAPANVTIIGAGSCSITASQPGNTNYLAATPATQSFSIDKANATITVTPYNVTYDGGAHTATATAVGVNSANLLSELDLSGTVHTNAGNYSDTWVFTDSTGNYNNASGVVNDIISKANAAIVVTPYVVVYDATSHTATGTATGVGGAVLTGLNLTATAHTNAGTYTDTWSFTDLTGNYYNASGPVTDVIQKATPTIAVVPYNLVYDGNAHVASGSATGVGGAVLAGLNLSATAHTNAGSYTDGWTFTDVTGNYYNASGSVNDIIQQATPTLAWSTPADISYGTALSGTQLNATATGVGGAALTGTFAYNPPAGTVLSAAPNQPLVVLFTPTDPNYTSNSATAYINVKQATPRIVWSNPADITYGTALSGTQLSAIAPAMPVGVTGWWTADENTGTTAHNAVGADSATLQGATWAPGKYNSAFSLVAAQQQYVDAGNTPDLQVSHGDFSVAAWVYFNSLTGDMSIVDKMGSVGNANDDGWRLLKQGDNHFWFCIGQQAGVNSCQPTTMAHSLTAANTGQWYFLVATKTASNVSIYVNGALEGGDGVGPIYDQDDANLRFGSYATQGAYLDGLIDEPMLFNHALSAAEVQALYGQQPGSFAYTPVSGTVLNAGQNQQLSATFAPTDKANYATAAASVQLNVLKADAAINVTGYNVTYDGNSHTATGTATGVKGEALAGLDLTATAHTNAGSYTDAWTFTDSTGNYNNATGTVKDSIARANATIAVTPYSVTYDGNSHRATGTATGVKGEALAGLDLSGTTNTNAGDYPSDPWSFTDVTGNYNNGAGTVHDHIAQATPVLKWTNPSSIVYGTALSGTQLDATAMGVNNSSLAGVFTYSPSAGTILPAGVQKLSVSFAPSDSVDYVSPVTTTVNVNVTYGVCPLIPQNPPSAIKSGATYPIKFYLCDTNGNDVSSSAIVVHATQIVLTSSVTGTPDDAGNSNPDYDFRYDSTLGPSGGYIYNLQTKGLVGGTWTMLFGAGYNASTGTYADPANASHTIQFGVK